jgi:hypothetical protein
MTRGHRGSLALAAWGSSIPCSVPVYPGAARTYVRSPVKSENLESSAVSSATARTVQPIDGLPVTGPDRVSSGSIAPRPGCRSGARPAPSARPRCASRTTVQDAFSRNGTSRRCSLSKRLADAIAPGFVSTSCEELDAQTVRPDQRGVGSAGSCRSTVARRQQAGRSHASRYQPRARVERASRLRRAHGGRAPAPHGDDHRAREARLQGARARGARVASLGQQRHSGCVVT